MTMLEHYKPQNTNRVENFDIGEIIKFSTKWEQALEAELRAVKYSSKTISSYLYFNRLFCNYMRKFPEEMTYGDITKFLAMYEKNRGCSAATMNLAISAVKFFYDKVLNSNVINEQRRPKQDKKLYVILSKDEIKKMLLSVTNIKHRLLLMLTYSSGLRVGEVVMLKKEDLCTDRDSMHIRLGKGRKDRITILSEKAVELYNEYCKENKIEKWIFPGQDSKKPLSKVSAQKIFQKAIQQAGIEKKVSIHCLRHSFATHLLEDGIDIRYIQKLLGHSSLLTTSKYTHIAKQNVLGIKSPLDSI